MCPEELWTTANQTISWHPHPKSLETIPSAHINFIF
jgi:hypothetical protein